MKVFRQSVQFEVPKGEELAKDQASATLSPWVNPGEMTEAQRAALVKQIEEGEVFSLRFRARTFGDGPNLNRTVLSRQQIKMLANTSKGVNLLNGHGGCFDGSEASQIVGEVLGGKTDKTHEGETVLVLDHRLADKEAMGQFARGLWRNFSISIGADDWQDKAFDENGKEVGFDSNYSRVERHAVGNVMLMHNAFVAEPAYRNTATIQPHSIGAKGREMGGVNRALEGDSSKAMEADSAEVAKLRADLAASEGKVAQLQAALDAEKKAYFNTMWDHMLSQGKVLPEEKEMFAAWAQASGNDKAKVNFCARLNSKHTVVPMSTIGAPPSETPANPAPPTPKGGPKQQSKAGVEMTDEEAEAEVNKYNLSRGGGKKKGK